MGRRSRRQKGKAKGRAGISRLIVNVEPPGKRKMSEVLTDVAEPLLWDMELPRDEREYEFALKIAALIWNASTFPTEAERRAALAELTELSGGTTDPRVERLFAEVFERARTRHPGEGRVIVDVEFVLGPDGRYHTNVASTTV